MSMNPSYYLGDKQTPLKIRHRLEILVYPPCHFPPHKKRKKKEAPCHFPPHKKRKKKEERRTKDKIFPLSLSFLLSLYIVFIRDGQQRDDGQDKKKDPSGLFFLFLFLVSRD